MILSNQTNIPSHVIRRDAYDARTDGHHMTLTEWLGAKRAQFEAAHPEHGKRSDAGRRAFDNWLYMRGKTG